MTVPHALIAFAIAAALLTITPGLDTALVLRTAAVEGPRRAWLAGTGICSGLFGWALAVSVGLGALLAVSHLAYNALRIVGACYLIYLGGKIFFRKSAALAETERLASAEVAAAASSESAARWFARGFLCNILNPKVGVFYVTFLPQFIPAGVGVTSFILLLASIHVAEGLLWFVVLISATNLLSSWLRRPRVAKAIDRVTGAVLVGFGLALALEKSR
ncbi:MAG TPA: LysE family translocator [Candidatus Acidoferrales bacterium]|nr:LysE family translocator [Candidatus Acidoferrales bacterium]